MDEQRIIELLTRKLAGEATQEELGELSYLLTKYPDAIYHQELLDQVWMMGKGGENPDLDNAFTKHKLKFKEDLKFEKKWTSYLKIPAYVLAAASLMVVIYFSAFYKHELAGQQIEVIAKKGIRKEIKLPDGTIVQLNSDSKITYNSEMGERDERIVSLSGEAFFKVAHDKEHPFIVNTNKIGIKVLGTEFNIKEYPGDRTSETTLLTGSIELTVNGRSDQKFFLKPTEKFALAKRTTGSEEDTGSVLVIDNISPVKLGDKEYIQEISWIKNQFVFENESFEELLPKLERWYNVKIILENQSVRSYHFTGVFIDENIAEALEAMRLIKPFNYKLIANEVKIY